MHTIAFIGTGIMGAPMAGHILSAGYELRVYNRTREKALPLLVRGAVWYATPAQCATDADAIITMVGGPHDVEEIYFGKEGILRAAKPGATLIDMTTSSPTLSVRIHAAAKERGLFALDAPVSGGDIGAKNATLSMMVGGEEDAFQACLPLLRCMGSRVIHVGGPGAGMHTKMANQIALSGVMAGISEAFAYAHAAGVDAQNVYDCISTGVAASWQMDERAPQTIRGDYTPGIYIRLFCKDLRLASEQASENGLTLPALNATRGMFEDLLARGMGELGAQALIEYFNREENA